MAVVSWQLAGKTSWQLAVVSWQKEEEEEEEVGSWQLAVGRGQLAVGSECRTIVLDRFCALWRECRARAQWNGARARTRNAVRNPSPPARSPLTGARGVKAKNAEVNRGG